VDFEKIVSILIKLLEDQEDAKITYRIMPADGKEGTEEETA